MNLLKKNLVKDHEINKLNTMKVMNDNVDLIRDINTLRK
jgi:hypothetical protein